jgi:hypothetical protein
MREALVGVEMCWVAIDAVGLLAIGIFGPALAMTLGAFATGRAPTFVWIFCFFVGFAGFFAGVGLRARLLGKVVVGPPDAAVEGAGIAGFTGVPDAAATGPEDGKGLAASTGEPLPLLTSTEGSLGFGVSFLGASVLAGSEPLTI